MCLLPDSNCKQKFYTILFLMLYNDFLPEINIVADPKSI